MSVVLCLFVCVLLIAVFCMVLAGLFFTANVINRSCVGVSIETVIA